MADTTPDDKDGMDPLEAEHLHAQIAKLISEAGKLQAEQVKLQRESRWYPFIAAAGFIAASAGLLAAAAGFAKLLHA